MATNTVNMSTWNAKRIIGDNASQEPTGALLSSGAGRADNSNTGDTWIFLDTFGGTTNPWGFKHSQSDNKIVFIGNDITGAWVQLNTGNIYLLGQVGIGYDPNTNGNTYKLYVDGNSCFDGNIIPTPTYTNTLGSTTNIWFNTYSAWSTLIMPDIDLTDSSNGITDNTNRDVMLEAMDSHGYGANSTFGAVQFSAKPNGDTYAIFSTKNYLTDNTTKYVGLYILLAKDGTGYINLRNSAATTQDIIDCQFTSNGNTVAINANTTARHIYNASADTYDLGDETNNWRYIYTRRVYIRHNNVQYGSFEINRNGATGTYGISQLTLGNDIPLSSTEGEGIDNACGQINIYGTGDTRTAIVSQPNGNRTFKLPNYDNTMVAAHVADNAQVGSDTKPVYVATNSRITVCSYELKATVNNGDTNYVAYYSGERAISSAKASTGMIMPAHYYHNLYNNNPTTGTTVYVHYYNGDTTSTNTFANLRVKSGTSYKTLAFGGDGSFSWPGTITSTFSGNLTGNASTATKATQDADGNDIRQKYVNVYNTSNVGNSSSVTFTNLAAAGNAIGMIYAATDNPRGSAGWVHCISLCWTKGTTSSWISQIAMSPQDSNGMWYRTVQGNIAGAAWKRVLDSSNYTSYTVTKTGSGASGTWGISISGNSATTSGGVNDVTFSSTGSNRARIFLRTVSDNPNDFYLGANNTNKWSISCRGSSESYYLGFYSAQAGTWRMRWYHDGHCYADSYLHNAVWNDIAECRKSDETEPGRVIIPANDGKAYRSIERLQSGGRIVSDTYGIVVGETNESKTPIGLAGRVLAYPYRNKEEYHIGDAVCSAPNGTVDIMTREEIMMYPERILGIVNEIPNYEIWNQSFTLDNSTTSQEVEVKGRIWIDIK